MKGNPRIAPTAHYTAQAWVRGGFPEAARFDTWLGRFLYHGVRLGKAPVARLLPANLRDWEQFLEARHRSFDAHLARFDPTVVVEIGAGLSGRGIALAERNPQLQYHEFDLPGMVAAKRARLPEMLPSNYHLAEGDILADCGLQVRVPADARLLVITEGLIPYLGMAEKQQAWRNVRALLAAAGEARYLLEEWPLEFLSGRRAGRWGARALGLLVGARMDQRLFDTLQDLLAALEQAGFAAVKVAVPELPGGEYGACPWRLVEAS